MRQKERGTYWTNFLQKVGAVSFVFMLTVNGFSQDRLSFKTIDAQTYQSYIEKDWDKVIELGKKALKQDIDYYFLRMRIGIAYFEKKNYRKAITHFEKAANGRPDEITAVEYLYYSYLNIGDDIQALSVLNRSNTELANSLLHKQAVFKNIFAFYSTRIEQVDKLHSQTNAVYEFQKGNQNRAFYVEQYIPESYHCLQFGTTVRLSPSWRTRVSYQRFSIDKTQIIIDPISEDKEPISLSQSQWNISNEFRLSHKMKAHLFLSYLSQNYEFITTDTSTVPRTHIKLSDLTSKNTLLGIGLKRHETYFGLSWGASYMSTAAKPVLQSSFSVSLFPFGNTNLSSTSGLSLVQADTTRPNLIFRQELSFKPHERINFSVVGIWGMLNQWNIDNGYSVYNDFYTISGLYQAKLTVRVYKKLYLKLLYESIQRESNIWGKSLAPPNKDALPEVISQTKFNTHSIIGGLIWEF